MDVTISFARKTIDGNEHVRRVYDENVARGGLEGETLQFALKKLEEGKTDEEVKQLLDEFINENKDRYREQVEKDLKEAIRADIEAGSPQLIKMWSAVVEDSKKYNNN